MKCSVHSPKNKQQFDVKNDATTIPSTKLPNGEVVEGVTTVYSFVASQTEKGKALLGSTPEATAEIDQWMSYRNVNLTPLLDTKLVPVNESLLSRAFIAGNSVTVADFAYYATVHEAAAGEYNPFPSKSP